MASILLPFDTNRWDAKEWDLNPHSDLFVGLVACAMPTPEVGLRGLPIDGTWTKTGANGTGGVLRDILGGAAWCTTSSGVTEFRLDISQSVITAAPISLAFIGTKNHTHGGSTTFNIISADNSASANNRDRVALYGSGAQSIGIRLCDNSAATNGPTITPGMPFGQIGCAVGVYKTATEYWSVVNGNKATTSTTSRVPSGINRLSIGSISASVWPFILKSGLWWNRALSEAEAIELSRDYRVLFRPKKRILYFGGGTSQTVSPGSGSISVSGSAPTISQPHTVAPSAGSTVYAGQAPAISQPHTVAPSAGAVTVSGYAPSIQQAAGIYPGAGAVEYAGQTPTISQPHTISPGVGAYDILGYAPTVSQAAGVAPLAGSIIVLGYAPAISQPITVAPGAGAATWLGYAPTISQEAMTLTPADLDAIAAAVWADPVAVAAHAKLDAIIARITC